jgi:hypothetical protein
MVTSFARRGICAAALIAGLSLAGCSSDKDVPEVVTSAPDGGTQVNTDTGSGGEFPSINTVPNQRPTSTIQDLNQMPDGLPGAQNSAQYGAPLVGGPTSSAQPPAPPPPPQELPPLPESGVQTQSDGGSSEPALEPTVPTNGGPSTPQPEPQSSIKAQPEATAVA